MRTRKTKEVNDRMMKLTVATLVCGGGLGIALAKGRERMQRIEELFRTHTTLPS